MQSKKCTRCGEIKGISEFYKDKRLKDGIRLYCKACALEYQRKYKSENAEKVREYMANWRAKNPDKMRNQRARYRIENAEKERDQNALYRAENADKIRECKAKNYAKNAVKIRKSAVLRYAENADERRAYSVKYLDEHAKYLTFASQLTVDDCAVEGPEGTLIVKCTYCGRNLSPKNKEVFARVAAINGRFKGERRLYCSSGCKKSCPTYWRQKHYKGEKIGHAREVPADFRHMALDDRGHACEKCGSNENGLHVHHIEGYTEQPMFSADLANVVVVCKSCHKAIHKQPGCRYVDYQCEDSKAA